MKALRFHAGNVAVADLPIPYASNEALVRVLKSGICNTDLEIARGYAGFEGILGHEFVGMVEEAADASDLVGRRVVGEINAGCNACSLCRRGDPRHCPNRTVLGIVGRDGAHAEFLRLPSRNLIPVPDSISDEQAVFAEPLAAANAISEQINVGAESRVAVIGDGKLGLLCAMALALRSSDVTVVGKHSAKLAIARDRGMQCLLADQADGTHDNAFDIVVEASGSEGGFAAALDLVRPRGTIVLKSTFHGTPTWAASRVVVDEITVVGSRCGRFAPALDLLAAGSVVVDDLIDADVPLSDGVEAMKRAGSRGALKILLSPSR